MPKNELNIELLEWNDVKDQILAANPNLFEILSQVSPKYSLIKARYRYGDKILKQGEIHLPLKNGGTIPLESNSISCSIREKLEYSYVPLSLILTKSVEVHFETDERVMPSKLFPTGTTFGLWEVFDPPPSEFVKRVWNLSAGARSAFMLPKIADNISHNRLKREYKISTYSPKKLLFHHHVFADLANKIENEWSCDVLFFCDGWLQEKDDNISCIKLHKYWLNEAWRQSYNCRNQMSYDVAWESFSKEVTRRNWKPRPYIINTIKHLMAISEGIFPGFIPSGGREDALPAKLIQDTYVNTYCLKSHAPIIMQPHHHKPGELPVYYTLYQPTLLEYAPKTDAGRSIMEDMRELKMLMNVLVLSTGCDDVKYDFFHCDADKFSEIRRSSEIMKEDDRFLECPKEYGERDFAESSPFFRGCIRISRA